MYTWENVKAMAGEFHLDEKKFASLELFFNALDPEFFSYCASLVTGDFPVDAVKERFSEADQCRFLLLVSVVNYPAMAEYYRRNGFPAQMLAEISCDLAIWMKTMEDDLGFYGLTWRIFEWVQACLKGEIKQFGRLQCNDIHSFAVNKTFFRNADGELEFLPGKQQVDSPVVIGYQDPCINLHIPATGPLLYGSCVASIKAMVDFSLQFNPDYDFRAVVCYSWILGKQFSAILPPESNIVQFRKLGHHFDMPDRNEDREVRWRLWGAKAANLTLDELECRTGMQRRVVDFWRNGGSFFEGGLIIFKDELASLK